ncbi:MAG TPA: IucA/IucC family protein, partial [Nitrococcus sp.]|nr:IucA/IucC family protein [Nitrococcus sp.]
MSLPSDAAAAPNAPAYGNEVRAAILRELLNAALQENLFGVCERIKVQRAAPFGLDTALLPIDRTERYASVTGPVASEMLVFRACTGDPLQPLRCSRPPVLAVAAERVRALSPAEVVYWLAQGQSARPGLTRLIMDLELAEVQGGVAQFAASAIAAELDQPRPCLAAWERLAALRDRPFHPLARVRRGWSEAEYRRYSAECAGRWPLHWIAVRRDRLVQAAGVTDDPASWLLCEEDREALAAEMTAGGLADYLAMPAHPWQARMALPRLLAEAVARAELVPLPIQLGYVQPSASIRTVIPAGDSQVHLKLALAIASLGALRPLPPRYLHNGSQAQRLLIELQSRDPVLGKRLRLCDETLWWCHAPGMGEPPADWPGHLACSLRRYPGPLGAERIPMASFAVLLGDGRLPAFDHVLARRGERGAAAALALFETLAIRLCELGFACFRAGIMPEAHGQNVLVELDDGEPEWLVLRDHDTLRIHKPWIEAAGLVPPDYHIDCSGLNTLILQRPETLLAYFQTLALQVNLRAIGHALVERYDKLSVSAVWLVVARAARQAMIRTGIEGPAAD